MRAAIAEADGVKGSTYPNPPLGAVIVDRDGSLAMAVGGILSQKTPRPIKVLYGGLEAYWNEAAAPLPPAAAAPAPAPALKSSAPLTAPAPAVPEVPKKTSAGC